MKKNKFYNWHSGAPSDKEYNEMIKEIISRIKKKISKNRLNFDPFEKIEKNPIGKYIMGAVKGVATAASLGVFGIIFNDPVTFFKNLGVIIDATLDEGKYTHLFTGIGGFAKEYVKLTENKLNSDRMQLLAGIK